MKFQSNIRKLSNELINKNSFVGFKIKRFTRFRLKKSFNEQSIYE